MFNRHAFPPILGAILCGVVITMWACAPAINQAPTAVPLNGAVLQPPTALPPLTFLRSDGSAFTTANTQGRYSLFYFGYTHCAEVCPLALSQLSSMRKSLGTDGDKLDMYFVTLDPQRDTPERMRTYLTNFPGVVGLIGSEGQIAAAQDTFGVQFSRRDLGKGDYALDHTAAMYLVNPSGEVQLAYPSGTDPTEITADLQRLLG
jgi:protein SCO1